MEAINNIDVQSLLATFFSVLVALVLGGAIGFELQLRQRTDGLPANTLLAVGRSGLRRHGRPPGRL